MHFEFLVEDSSGKALLRHLVPKAIGPLGGPHTWRLIDYRGVGRIPSNLLGKSDPQKRILLQRLPKLLQGYGKTSGIDAVVIVLDADRRDCKEFLRELNALAASCKSSPKPLFRLAIEEIEAWYFGDRKALLKAYPKAKKLVLDGYVQDGICGTWETLADAVYPGGSLKLNKTGWPAPGRMKHEWANKIGPFMELDRNKSPSLVKFCMGLRRLVDGG